MEPVLSSTYDELTQAVDGSALVKQGEFFVPPEVVVIKKKKRRLYHVIFSRDSLSDKKRLLVKKVKKFLFKGTHTVLSERVALYTSIATFVVTALWFIGATMNSWHLIYWEAGFPQFGTNFTITSSQEVGIFGKIAEKQTVTGVDELGNSLEIVLKKSTDVWQTDIRCLLPDIDIKELEKEATSTLKNIVEYLIKDCIYVNIDQVRSPDERINCEILRKRAGQGATESFNYWTVCHHTQAVLPLMIFGGIFGGIGSLLLVALYTCYPVGIIFIFPCYFLGGALQLFGLFSYVFSIPLEAAKRLICSDSSYTPPARVYYCQVSWSFALSLVALVGYLACIYMFYKYPLIVLRAPPQEKSVRPLPEDRLDDPKRRYGTEAWREHLRNSYVTEAPKPPSSIADGDLWQIESEPSLPSEPRDDHALEAPELKWIPRFSSALEVAKETQIPEEAQWGRGAAADVGGNGERLRADVMFPDLRRGVRKAKTSASGAATALNIPPAPSTTDQPEGTSLWHGTLGNLFPSLFNFRGLSQPPPEPEREQQQPRPALETHQPPKKVSEPTTAAVRPNPTSTLVIPDEFLRSGPIRMGPALKAQALRVL